MNNITNFQNDLITSFETTKQDQNTSGHHSITYYPGHKGRQFVYNNGQYTRTMDQEILKQHINYNPSNTNNQIINQNNLLIVLDIYRFNFMDI